MNRKIDKTIACHIDRFISKKINKRILGVFKSPSQCERDFVLISDENSREMMMEKLKREKEKGRGGRKGRISRVGESYMENILRG